MTPIISIVMPCFNSATYVRSSIESALAQSLGDIEVLVIDNGSTDETVSIASGIRDGRVRVLHEPVRGVSAARNAGIRAARADFIAFLDSDDWWSPLCLSKLHAALVVRPNALLAYCGWQNVGLPGPRGEPFIPPDYETSNKLPTLFSGCRWPIHAALTRRAAVLKAGAFDTRLTNAEDFLLWLEIAGNGPIARVPEVLAFYRFHHGNQASTNQSRAALNQLEAQKTYLRAHPEFAAQLGKSKARELMIDGLMSRGYNCYWRRDLRSARTIFRQALREHGGKPKDWKYLLPALLPYPLHKFLLSSLGKL